MGWLACIPDHRLRRQQVKNLLGYYPNDTALLEAVLSHTYEVHTHWDRQHAVATQIPIGTLFPFLYRVGSDDSQEQQHIILERCTLFVELLTSGLTPNTVLSLFVLLSVHTEIGRVGVQYCSFKVWEYLCQLEQSVSPEALQHFITQIWGYDSQQPLNNA